MYDQLPRAGQPAPGALATGPVPLLSAQCALPVETLPTERIRRQRTGTERREPHKGRRLVIKTWAWGPVNALLDSDGWGVVEGRGRVLVLGGLVVSVTIWQTLCTKAN